MGTKTRSGFLVVRLTAILLATGASTASITLFDAIGHGARSQAARTIKIIAPVPPGAPADTLPRLLAEQIDRAHGVSVVVENRPGAGTLIGTETVSRSLPDGSTLLMNGNPILIIPHMQKASYDPLTSFEPICRLATAPNVIAVNSASSYRTLADLLDAARAKPAELTLASIGPGTATQIAFETLKRAARVDMTFVPYPGTAPAINALLGGHVTSYFGNYPVVAEHLKTGKLRLLAVATRTRTEALPEVPTVAESGYKDFVVDFWTGLFAPAKTPKETVSQLAEWFSAAVRAPEVKAKLAVQGLLPAVMCGTDFAAFLRKQYDDYGRVIREANIKAE
jgi:tripartite-type tricarboxylate transporter receptor subunit TctC